MTITLTKKKLAALVSVIVVSLVAVTTAGALDSFPDVADGRFFHDPVTWASTNGITTGTSPITFEPDRGVTRGESVTFLKRYDDNIVQPALATNTADIANNTSDIATNTADIDALETDKADTTAVYTQAEVDALLAASAPLFATVEADGTLVAGRSSGASSVTKDAGLGTYRVFFGTNDISACIFLATPSDLSQAPETVQVGIQGSPLGTNGVFIQSANNADALVDSGFFMAILC